MSNELDLFGDLKKEIGAIYHCNQCGKELPIKNEDGGSALPAKNDFVVSHSGMLQRRE
jgi:hypothetical protein